MDTKKIFCSLDIETSGFDPLTEEILEVGFCFFEVTKKGIKITEEWSRVFKPTKVVSSKILGLTGITQKELDSAPSFSKHKEFLQDKLESAVIVGHNIVFDIRFLESNGIKFSGGTIDTLDLVQWLLPTRHSYNLENLMHYFEVSHIEAHRALADAKAALKVLEKLFGIYSGFSIELKKEVLLLLNNSDFLWKKWLDLTFQIKSQHKSNINKETESIKKNVNAKARLKFKTQTIYNFPLFSSYFEDILTMLDAEKGKTLLVVPKKAQVVHMWEQNRAKPVFFGEDLFDEKKFSKFCKKKNKTAEEVKFLLKVLVWKYTNWQNECLLDLNLSFFGGQFKELVSRNRPDIDDSARRLMCDYSVFLEIYAQKEIKNRKVILISLQDFENALNSGIGQKVSWGFVSYVLKGIYNPETGDGNKEYKDLVIELINATDMFFGLSCALLKNEATGFEYFKVTESARYFENFIKLQKAAETYAEKLNQASKVLKIDSLKKTSENLTSFFAEEPNRVKWIELAETRSVFFNNPLNLKSFTEKIIKHVPNISFADALPIGNVLDLFVSRLGLEEFVLKGIDRPKKLKSLQQDLFSKLFFSKEEVSVTFFEKSLATDDILRFCKKTKYPLAILFASPLSVREFYEQNFQELGNGVNLLTQNQSGGSNKIFRNFKIYKDSALLVTDKFVLKYLENENTSLENVVVKTLVIGKLPFEQYTHPYLEAVASAFENPFEQFSLPRAVLNLLKIIKFFFTPNLQEIVLADSKLAKPYAKAFKLVLSQLPNTTVEDKY